MRRFQGLGHDVRPMSECNDKDGGQERDPSGRPAALFEVRDLTPLNNNEVTVRASWSLGHSIGGGGGFDFRVKRVLGQWSVTDAKTVWVE